VVRGIGPVVPSASWPGEDIVTLGRTEGYELDYVISGVVSQSDAGTSLRLELWDIQRGEALDALAKETTADDAGAVVMDLAQQLVGRLVNEGKVEAVSLPTYYTVPTGSLLAGSLAADDMLLMLTLAAEGLSDAERLFGERDMLNHLLSLSLGHRQVLGPKLALFTGLVLNRARGSSIYLEYRAPVLALADSETDPSTDAYAVTALAYYLFDRAEALEGRLQELSEHGRADAAKWLSSFRPKPKAPDGAVIDY
jgi:hypothetical protein